MQILSDSISPVNTVITPKIIKKGELNRTFRDSVNKDRYKANKKHRDLLGLMVGHERTGRIFQSLIKNWFCPTLQHHIQLAKAYYVEVILGSDVSHPYGHTYSHRDKLGSEGRFKAISATSVTRSTTELKKLGMIEKGVYTGRRVYSRKKTSNSLNNLKLQIGEYRPSFKGLLAWAKEAIQKHGLEKEFTSPYAVGLDDTLIFSAIFGVDNFAWLSKEARKMTLSDLDEEVRKALIEEDSRLTPYEQEKALEDNQGAALAAFSSESNCVTDYITTNVVNNKYTKTSPTDEVEVLKKSDLGDEDQSARPPQRHPGGIKRFLASYETPQPLDLTVSNEPPIEPVVDYATKAPVPNNLPDAFNNTQAVANRLGKSLKTRPNWQPDMNTQLARNWRAEILGQEASRPNTQVQYTGEVRGRYRVLESTQTHEKAPPAAKEHVDNGGVKPNLEMALQRLLNAAKGQEEHKAVVSPVELSPKKEPEFETEEERLIRERLEAKRKALGFV